MVPRHNAKKSRKLKTLQQKVELLDRLRTAKSVAAVARHYGINESTVRYIKKKEKEIREVVAAVTPARAKILYHVRDPYLSHVENATFSWMQDLQSKGISVDSTLIREKARFFYSSLKGLDEDRATSTTTTMKFQASKGWFDRFRKRFGLGNVNFVASADQEANQDSLETPEISIKQEPTDSYETTLVSDQPIEEDDLLKLTVPKVEIETDIDEDRVVEDKFTFDNIAIGLRKIKDALDFFCDIDSSMVRALEVKESVEQAILPYSNIFKEMKKTRSQRDIAQYFQRNASLPPSSSSTGDTTRPTPETPLLMEHLVFKSENTIH